MDGENLMVSLDSLELPDSETASKVEVSAYATSRRTEWSKARFKNDFHFSHPTVGRGKRGGIY